MACPGTISFLAMPHPLTRARTLALVSLSLSLVAAPAAAQQAPPRRSMAGVELGRTTFEGAMDPWSLASVWVGRRLAPGPLFARANYAERFGAAGMQGELEAYPRLSRRAYAYLNLGYSEAAVFPRWRSGAELYVNLPRAWELSAGYRQLRFEDDDVTLLTGTVARYVGNYWISLRPFARVGASSAGEGREVSGTVTARRYFADPREFVGASAGYGRTPGDRLTPVELARTNTTSAGVHGAVALTGPILATWAATFEREELPLDRERRRWDLLLGMRVDW